MPIKTYMCQTCMAYRNLINMCTFCRYCVTLTLPRCCSRGPQITCTLFTQTRGKLYTLRSILDLCPVILAFCRPDVSQWTGSLFPWKSHVFFRMYNGQSGLSYMTSSYMFNWNKTASGCNLKAPLERFPFRDVLVCYSVAVIKCCPKPTWEEKGLL